MTKTRANLAHDLLFTVAGVSGEPHIGALWAIQAWLIAESGDEPCTGMALQGAANNGLNTTLREVGSTPYNGAGVQNYKSYADGLAATVSTLADPRYTKIVAAMRSTGSDGFVAQNVLWQVTGSPWGTDGHTLYGALAAFQVDHHRYNNLPFGT